MVMFKRKTRSTIEHMSGIMQVIIQRAFNERLIREFEGLLKGIKNLTPCNILEVKKIDKNIVLRLNQIKAMIDENAPDDKILALTTDTGLQLLEREQKRTKTRGLPFRLRYFD